MKILGITVMVPVRSTIKQLLSGMFLSIPQVDVFGIIELLQHPVIPAFLLIDHWTYPVGRMKIPHCIGIVYMALGNIKNSPLLLCCSTICELDLKLRVQFFYLMVKHPSNAGHESCTFERWKLQLPSVEYSSRLVVLWGMTFIADGCKITHCIRTTLTPISDMVDVKDHPIRSLLSTALAGIIIPCKDCLA